MILFLDFDGVTHPEPYDQEAAFQQLPFIEAVVRDMVGVEIVVSSSWRESHSLEELREFFALDIRSRVVGVTPDIWNPEQPQPFLRESECMAWLAENRPVGTRWLAIDDRPSWFQPNCPNLFVTDTTQGFLSGQMEMLRVMLMTLLGRKSDEQQQAEFDAAVEQGCLEDGSLLMLKERQRKDAENVAAGQRSPRSLLMFQKGDLKDYRFTQNPDSEFERGGEGL